MWCSIPYDGNRMGQKEPILCMKNINTSFPGFTNTMGFCCILLIYVKLMGKPTHFPCDEVYYRMKIRWGKGIHTMGKVWVPIFPGFPHTMGFVAFSYAVGYWCQNPCISHMIRFTNFFLLKGEVHSLTPNVDKMVKHALKIFQHLLQDF